MKDIIELLQKERIKTVDALKNGNKQELSYLQQIDKALGWLKLIEEKGLENVDAMTYIACQICHQKVVEYITIII